MELLLWIIAVVFVVAGVVWVFRNQMMWGLALIVLGLLIGPGGVSVLS